MYMKTEWNDRPQLVEVYPTLVRINANISETTRQGMDDESYTVYLGEMVELAPTEVNDLATILHGMNATIEEAAEIAATIGRDALDVCKSLLDKYITDYDSSSAVNSFVYGGNAYWLDKATRVGLMNSTTILKASGEESTSLWLGSTHVTLPCDNVIAMLSALEVYALNCYNVTASHKAEVAALDNIEEVKAYDYKGGYPAKLVW